MGLKEGEGVLAMLEALKRGEIVVEEFTTPSPFSVTAEENLLQLEEIMAREGIRHVPVVRAGVPIGIVSDRDLRVVKNFSGHETFLAEQIMTPDPFTVSPDMPLDQVAYEMSQRKIGSAIVVDEEGKVIGIFTSTDALNALVELVRGQLNR